MCRCRSTRCLTLSSVWWTRSSFGWSAPRWRSRMTRCSMTRSPRASASPRSSTRSWRTTGPPRERPSPSPAKWSESPSQRWVMWQWHHPLWTVRSFVFHPFQVWDYWTLKFSLWCRNPRPNFEMVPCWYELPVKLSHKAIYIQYHSLGHRAYCRVRVRFRSNVNIFAAHQLILKVRLLSGNIFHLKSHILGPYCLRTYLFLHCMDFHTLVSHCDSFMGVHLIGLLVQGWETDSEEKRSLQEDQGGRWNVCALHSVRHEWWWWKLHSNGCQSTGIFTTLFDMLLLYSCNNTLSQPVDPNPCFDLREGWAVLVIWLFRRVQYETDRVLFIHRGRCSTTSAVVPLAHPVLKINVILWSL